MNDNVEIIDPPDQDGGAVFISNAEFNRLLNAERTAWTGPSSPTVDYSRIAQVLREVLAESRKPLDSVVGNTHGRAEIIQELGDTRSESRYWRLDRAAQECNVSPRTFAEWMADGKVHFFKLGRVVLIDPVELKADLSKFQRQRTPRRRMRRTEPRS